MAGDATNNAVTDASGRTFYRHSSGMGTVMTWRDKAGRTHNTLVLDASYRTALQWGGYGTDIPSMTNYTNSNYYLCSGTATRTSTDETSIYATSASNFFANAYTDDTINAKSGYFEDATSSKIETDRIITALGNNTTHAAGYCRSKTVDGIGCDLPNIQTLIRIYCSMFTLDEMDTSTGNNSYKFTKVQTGKNTNWTFENSNLIWSSTEFGSSSGWPIHYHGEVGYSYENRGHKNQVYGVVPILEL